MLHRQYHRDPRCRACSGLRSLDQSVEASGHRRPADRRRLGKDRE
jgi:hypothetical protein